MPRLTSRVEALEQGGGLASVIVVKERDEDEQDAISRNVADRGPITGRKALVVTTGVPRA